VAGSRRQSCQGSRIAHEQTQTRLWRCPFPEAHPDCTGSSAGGAARHATLCASSRSAMHSELLRLRQFQDACEQASVLGLASAVFLVARRHALYFDYQRRVVYCRVPCCRDVCLLEAARRNGQGFGLPLCGACSVIGEYDDRASL
jgi:hypothetical protein